MSVPMKNELLIISDRVLDHFIHASGLKMAVTNMMLFRITFLTSVDSLNSLCVLALIYDN